MVVVHGALAAWFGQLARGFLAEQDLERFVREESTVATARR